MSLMQRRHLSHHSSCRQCTGPFCLWKTGTFKAAMNAFREVHAHVTASARSERAQYLRGTENTVGWTAHHGGAVFDPCHCRDGTSVLGGFPSIDTDRMLKLELQQKLTELDKEVALVVPCRICSRVLVPQWDHDASCHSRRSGRDRGLFQFLTP